MTRFMMPAEWEHHEATWLTWPKDPLTFPAEILVEVEDTFAKIVRALAIGETVNLLVDNEDGKQKASSKVGEVDGVRYHILETADVWMRDYGPIFVRNGNGLTAVKWRFNAWGNKYDELKPDDAVGLRVAEISGYPIVRPGMILEGGSIDTNGRGTCLTTEQCLLNPNRNPDLSKEQISEALRRYLGFEKVVWLKSGIVGDDTDGHIDDIARFVDARTVVCMVEDDPADANFCALQEDLRLLKGATDKEGRPLRIVPVSMPEKKVGGDAERLPASYANFYVGNSAVLVPTFDDANDVGAISKLKAAFPTREVIGLNCEALVYGFGGIHCVTQQQPTAGR